MNHHQWCRHHDSIALIIYWYWPHVHTHTHVPLNRCQIQWNKSPFLISIGCINCWWIFVVVVVRIKHFKFQLKIETVAKHLEVKVGGSEERMRNREYFIEQRQISNKISLGYHHHVYKSWNFITISVLFCSNFYYPQIITSIAIFSFFISSFK